MMPARKRIALVAHDNFKVKMVEWCDRWNMAIRVVEFSNGGFKIRKVFA